MNDFTSGSSISWSPEVRTGSDPKYYGNMLRFATKEEADAYAADLADRWKLVVECRSVESDKPVNYRWNFDRKVAEPVR
jgi:hypothetical protein